MTHKAGFVNILGNPNVGKSTLMNKLVGEKLSIITNKSQTTRHRIMGIVNGEDFQIVYSDTPGIIKPNYRLQKSMMHFVDTAIEDADIILYMTDVVEDPEKNKISIDRIARQKKPTLVLINKIDQTNQIELESLVEKWAEKLPEASILPIAAKHKLHIDKVFDYIMHHLPEGDPYFPKDELTDRSLRFFASEIVREKILLYYKQEVPYSVEVEITSYKEDKRIAHIEGNIYVSRESQKGILIGHQGEKLKKVGTAARKDIEEFLGKKVFLELFVKVDPEWRDNDKKLRKFGYIE
ncbi:GTPase Era [Salinivirga cyanobacteriivorans]|uniref:GTPase Era n=1 Tax=Salinivirga cyanobacteriivorans TaxID=1307839 RepID=A0A0S2I2X3_9BACT|nr:GTPase Era [Salinivirga cyanobacteriivorans]ALO16628.1 GTPase Era [Salinivirga cyanobacteriivorans]